MVHSTCSRRVARVTALAHILRSSLLGLLVLVTATCVAQQLNPQFPQPLVYTTGGQVTSFVAGQFQVPSGGTDILYLDSATMSGGVSSVAGGLLLNNQPGFQNLKQNEFNFTSASKVVAAAGDFDQDNHPDFAFAVTPQSLHDISFCVYYGTGATAGSNQASYSPLTAKSGCLSFPAQGTLLPNLAYIASWKYQAGQPPYLMIEDSANKYLYILPNNGTASTTGGGLVAFAGSGISLVSLPEGAGPIYTGDLNGDGVADIVINGQNGHSATVYLSQGTNFNLSAPAVYRFSHNIHSLLMQDMDGDGHPDMVVEGDNGIIEIHHGNSDGTFVAASEGGTAAGVDGFSGNGGQLAAIDPNTHDIYTATPIGLSRLSGSGSLNYVLKGIYNVGSGRNSYALADFYGNGVLDLAVDSAEGVAISVGDGAGGFQTSLAYAALQPALSSATGEFSGSSNVDVVVSTGAVQGQLLTGNGSGGFSAFGGVTNTSGGPSGVPANLWSNVVAGDFNGNGTSDIAYSLTGSPVLSSGSGLYLQYGNGNGTFASPVAISGAGSGNTLFGASTVADFNGDGNADIANSDAGYNDTLLGQSSGTPFAVGLNQAASKNSFNQVAAGYFKMGRTTKQDLIFQQGNSLVPYLNSGDGAHFTAEPALSGTPSSSTLVLSAVMMGDLDNDGKGDVAAVYYSTAAGSSNGQATTPAQLYVWYGNGDGTFSSQPQIVSLTRNDYLGAIVDLNQDGYSDIVMADGSVITALYNLGGRKFVSDFGSTTCNPCSEQHFLAGQGINSLSVADVNNDGSPDIVVANGGATISNAIALGATTQSSVALTPNPDVNTGGITVLLNHVVTHPVTGTLTATPEPSTYQATFTLNVTLTSASGIPAPTGSVEFFIDGQSLGFVNLTPGTTSSTASYTIPAGNSYAVGSHTLSASYSGDSVNSKLNVNGTHQIVAASNISTTTDIFLCVGPTAACPSTGGINPPPPYVATLTMSYGQTWNGVTDAYASDGSALTGTIALNETFGGATNVICTLQVSSGGACPASVGTTIGTAVGTHVFQSVYSGDATHAGSSSRTVTINVLQDTTTATLTASPNPSPAGQPVTLNATFTGNAAPPTGTVTFTYAGNTIGAATLAPGTSGFSSTASLATSSLPVGTDTVTVTYAGNTNFGAASASTTVTISPPLTGNFTLSVAPNPVNIGVGAFAQLGVTITSHNGFNQPVQFACSGLPSEATCTFLSNTINGSGTTVLYVGTTAPHTCGTTTPYFIGSNGGWGLAPLGVPALAGVLVLFIPGRRRGIRSLLTVLLIVAAGHLTGCGNCTDLGTRPNTYTIQVTATSASTSEVETQPVTINVVI